MFLSRWFTCKKGRPSGAVRPRRISYRPWLEDLETRTSPALLVPQPPFPSGGNDPVDVAVADFDGDNKQDLAVTHFFSNDISVFLGQGNGTFIAAPGSPFVTGGANPIPIVVGDFNGDNKPDLAVGNVTSNDVSVFLGQGNGTFIAAPLSPFFSGGLTPTGLAVGDFNGDTRQDLAVTNQNSNNVAVFLGQGNGTFLAAPGSPFGTGGGNPRNVVVGDFNGDTKQDLAVTNQGGSVAVFLGQGNGTFLAAPGSPFGSGGTNPFGLVVGDFNGDTKQDLALTNQFSDNVSVFLGQGNGTFVAAVGAPFGSGGTGPYALAVGDFNGDNRQDLAVTNETSNNVAVFLGQGNGTFLAATGSPFNPGVTGPLILATGDFNGDGGLDLAQPGGLSNNVAILLNGTVTTVALTTSAATITVGQSVTFSVTVVPTLPGQPTPTGIITFLDGANFLGTATLSNGSANFTTSTLTVGGHIITAVYSGDSNFRSTRSAQLAETVSPLPRMALP